MKRPLFIILSNETKILINEDQVSSISPCPDSNNAVIRMSNGDEFIVSSPSYKEWENDIYLRASEG